VLTAAVSGSPSLKNGHFDGTPLVFSATLPARSSRAFVLSAEQQQSPPDHVLLAPDLATRAAGQPIAYTLTAYDAFDNDWDVTISGAYTIEPGAGGDWTSNVYTADVIGSWIVTGSYGGKDDTASLIVWTPTDFVYLPVILREFSTMVEVLEQ